MPHPPELVEFVRRFEPVLYFHKDERFFPVDPKRYIEASALWRTRRPTRTKDDWGEQPPGVFPKTPLVRRGDLAAANTSPAESGTDKWLGNQLPAQPEREDRFLALASWEDSISVNSVESTTQGRHSSLNAISNLYRLDVDPGLNQSRFWYYAELFGPSQLAVLLRENVASTQGINFELIQRALNSPILICYHLFYAAHEEPLQGCQGFNEDSQFASFAGEWTCIAVLVEDRTPTHIGLTQRNVGSLTARDDESRIGMTVKPWSEVTHVQGHPDHPKVYVGRGTHSYYLTTGGGSQPIKPFTSERFDIARSSCENVESLDDTFTPGRPEGREIPSFGSLIVKLLIPFTGWTLFALEMTLVPAEFALDPGPVAQPTDLTPSGNQFGLAIRPSEISMSEIASESTPVTSSVPWRTSQQQAPGGEVTTADGRKYGFIVDRTSQIWWPTRSDRKGYDGRWGAVVDHDPKNRRSGMRVPRFWLMFMIALARKA
jgi:hypothetical protein